MEILNDMRQGKFLFVILSLVGAQNVFGQNWYLGGTYTNINPSTTNVGIGVAILPAAVAPIAKLQVIGTTIFPSAIFSTGKVGIGGLGTSFTTAASVTHLLHVKDGDAFFQNSTLRISKPGGEALLVSSGISRLVGGIYVGSQQIGGGASMEYGLDGIFKIQSRSNSINYNFLLDGNMTLSATTGYEAKINAQQLNLYNSIGDGYDYGAIRMGQSGTNFWHIGQASGDNSFRIMRCSGTNFLTSMVLDYTTGNLKIANRVDIGGKTYTPTDATVKLAVAGTLVAQKVKVTAATNWGDFVFDKSYALQPLTEVEQYVKANNHLPNIPSATELEASGIDTGEMLRLQMIKIEELTLHLIAQQKEIQEMKTQLKNVRSK